MKNKHFRKDVILARIVAGVLLIVLIVLLVLGISQLSKSSGEDKDSQNTQSSQNTEYQDTEEDIFQQNTEEVEETEGTEETIEPEDTEEEPEVEIWVITTANLNLREEPNTSCDTLERIPENTKLTVLEDLDGWYKVTYYGKVGYVSKTYVEISEEE